MGKEAEDKLQEEKAARLREAEQRLDASMSKRLKETEQQLRGDADRRLKETKRKVEKDSADTIDAAGRRFLKEGEEAVQAAQAKLRQAKERLATLKGDGRAASEAIDKRDASEPRDGDGADDASRGSYDYSERSASRGDRD